MVAAAGFRLRWLASDRCINATQISTIFSCCIFGYGSAPSRQLEKGKGNSQMDGLLALIAIALVGGLIVIPILILVRLGKMQQLFEESFRLQKRSTDGQDSQRFQTPTPPATGDQRCGP